MFFSSCSEFAVFVVDVLLIDNKGVSLSFNMSTFSQFSLTVFLMSISNEAIFIFDKLLLLLLFDDIFL